MCSSSNSNSTNSHHHRRHDVPKRLLRFVLVTTPCLVVDGLRLTAFVLLLLPGFLRFAWYYHVLAERTPVSYARTVTVVDCDDDKAAAASDDDQGSEDTDDESSTPRRRRRRRSSSSSQRTQPVLPWLHRCRQTLDVYTAVPSSSASASNESEKKKGWEGQRLLQKEEEPELLRPVLVFFSGGAWIIGYKMWAALLARCLTACGVVVVVPDYRNYPVATVPDMVDDVELALKWTREHIREYGGDPNRVVLAGQSAGGHLVMTALLRQQLARLQRRRRRTRRRLVEQQAAGDRVVPAREQRQQQQQTAVLKHRRTSSTTTTVTTSTLDAEDDESSSLSSLSSAASAAAGEYEIPGTDDPSPPAVVDDGTYNNSRTWNGNGDSDDDDLDIRGLITLSAPYSLNAMQDTFTSHGMDSHLVDRIFGATSSSSGDGSRGGGRDEYDPFALLLRIRQEQQELSADEARLRMPPVRIYHGDMDRTVPHAGSVQFARKLRELVGEDERDNDDGRGRVEFHSYRGWSHTDAILEAPIKGDHTFHRDVFLSVREWTSTEPEKENGDTMICWPGGEGATENHPGLARMCPDVLVDAGRSCMPF